MKKRIGKYDLIFISLIFAVITLFTIIFYSKYNQNGDFAVVTVDGKEYGRYPLCEDTEIDITDATGQITNILSISNNTATMSEASCPDKLCMKHKAISLEKETIVCLPNKVVVTIESDTDSDLDALSN